MSQISSVYNLTLRKYKRAQETQLQQKENSVEISEIGNKNNKEKSVIEEVG